MSPRLRSHAAGGTCDRKARQVSKGPWPRQPDESARRDDAAAEPDHVVGVGGARDRAGELRLALGIATGRDHVAECRFTSLAAAPDAEERDAVLDTARRRDRPIAEEWSPVAPPQVFGAQAGAERVRLGKRLEEPYEG